VFETMFVDGLPCSLPVVLRRFRHSRNGTRMLDFTKEGSVETGRAANIHPDSICLC
jgi:hypothetical protein